MNPTAEKAPVAAQISFYAPFTSDGIERIPEAPEDYWSWILAHPKVGEGKYTWTLQTYLFMKKAGLPCRLVTQLPTSGIVVSHRDFLHAFQPPRAGLFLICIKADRNEHPWAHFHVVQNERDSLLTDPSTADQAAAMEHWPQPSLLQRDAARGTRCENLGYFGRELNLATQLRSQEWTAELAQGGFQWSVRDRPNWHDYHDIDVTISVRDFETHGITDDPVLNADSKPASKLINSWRAGVPAIVGRESAFRRARRTGLDFIEVESLDDLRGALATLRANPSLYRDMVANGQRRAAEHSPETVTAQWKALLTDGIRDEYSAWRSKSAFTRLSNGYRRTLGYFLKPAHIMSLLSANLTGTSNRTLKPADAPADNRTR
jgi:Glycosyl transferases group 1